MLYVSLKEYIQKCPCTPSKTGEQLNWLLPLLQGPNRFTQRLRYQGVVILKISLPVLCKAALIAHSVICQTISLRSHTTELTETSASVEKFLVINGNRHVHATVLATLPDRKLISFCALEHRVILERHCKRSINR
ncbi:hypothetical protein CEXT_729641 [Caerostris extrusa]|uniref:Uncharacterized protein n=1 Tax=Caerostris extrusa TaxID=172846 RepID=A0AAV4R2L5_CAEEX|nr:hypothetical protein CEXT_729641 [Caerostris extrusa]